MSQQDRVRWDAKHRERSGTSLGSPLSSLAWLPRPRAPALALDLACGRGRHCRALLDAGYSVVAADVSRAALADLRGHHERDAARIFALQADFDAWPFGRSCFDVVIQCDFLDRGLFDSIKRSVRPGGHVLVDTFSVGSKTDRGPRNVSYRLVPGELARVFADWEIVRRRTSGEPEARDAILARRPPRLAARSR